MFAILQSGTELGKYMPPHKWMKETRTAGEKNHELHLHDAMNESQ